MKTDAFKNEIIKVTYGEFLKYVQETIFNFLTVTLKELLNLWIR